MWAEPAEANDVKYDNNSNKCQSCNKCNKTRSNADDTIITMLIYKIIDEANSLDNIGIEYNTIDDIIFNCRMLKEFISRK